MAQPSSQPPRVGVLVSGALGELSISDDRDRYAAFLSGLRELGYAQGRNIVVDLRETKGRLDLFPVLAAELVRLKVAAIVVSGATAIEPATKATKTIPIVMIAADDPVGREFVASLSLPGGNVTGLSGPIEGMRGKQMELLKDAIPWVTRVAVLDSHDRKGFLEEFQRAAKALRIELAWVEVSHREQLGAPLPKSRPCVPTPSSHYGNR